jgi:hypothetical protein
VFKAGRPAAMLLVAGAAWTRPRPVRRRTLDRRRTLVLPLLSALLGSRCSSPTTSAT